VEITLKILDEVNCKFIGLPLEHRKALYNKNKVFDPSMKYIPQVKMGLWSGEKHYFSMGGETYINLLEPILQYLIDNGFEINIEDNRSYNRNFQFDPIDNTYLSHISWPATHQLAGQPIILRDHQVIAANTMMDNIQSLSILCTGFGKSALTAVLSKKVEKYGRSIVIVPNKDLITQTEAYYKLIGLDVGVYYGTRKEFFKKHTICTWQSLGNLSKTPLDIGLADPMTIEKFSEGVVAVMVDECHGLKGSILTQLMTKNFATIPIRWGLTGTMPKEDFENINLKISIGEIVQTVRSIDMQEIGVLSKCDVKVIQLEDYKQFPDYQTEYSYLVTDPARLTFIAKMITGIADSGNTLVLVGRKETGEFLQKQIPNSVFISSKTKSTSRKEHYDEVETSTNKVIIATSQLAAVGLDIPKLSNLVMIENGKSFVRTIQSIGRVLRTHFAKDGAIIWDICSTCRHSKKHLTQRKKYYSEQEFPFTIEKVIWQQ